MRLLSLLLVSVLSMPGCAELAQLVDGSKGQPQPLAPLIYIANEGSNTVSVIDALTYQPVGAIDTKNAAPHDLALSSDENRLYVTGLVSGQLSVIDTRGRVTLASIYTGARCRAVALTQDNRFAWVANAGENTVSIVDTATYRVVGAIAAGRGPAGLTFSRDGRFAYVSNQGDRAVAVVDTSSLKVVKTIPVGEAPGLLTLGPDGRIWGGNAGGRDIFVIDPATQTKVATLEVGPNPQQIAFANKGTAGPNAYVTLAGADQIAVVGGEPGTLRVLERIPTGAKPNGIWANPEGTRIYVGHEAVNEVRVFDTGTLALLSTVPAGKKPIRVLVSGYPQRRT